MVSKYDFAATCSFVQIPLHRHDPMDRMVGGKVGMSGVLNYGTHRDLIFFAVCMSESPRQKPSVIVADGHISVSRVFESHG